MLAASLPPAPVLAGGHLALALVADAVLGFEARPHDRSLYDYSGFSLYRECCALLRDLSIEALASEQHCLALLQACHAILSTELMAMQAARPS